MIEISENTAKIAIECMREIKKKTREALSEVEEAEMEIVKKVWPV